MDQAVEEYKRKTSHTDPEVKSTFTETGTFGTPGWSIRRRRD